MPPLPPGSRQPAFLQTIQMRDPVRYFETLRRRHGPVFRMKLLGFPPQVVVSNAELANRIYATDGDGSRAGALRAGYVPWVGEHSLLTNDGEEWWRHRKLLSPTLHGRSIAGYPDMIAEIAAQDIRTWPLGTPFALREHMQAITLEVTLRLVFGVADPHQGARLRAALMALSKASGSPALFLTPARLRSWAEKSPLAARLPFLPTTRAMQAAKAVDHVLFDEISRRRNEQDDEATDVLGRLVRARDDEGQPMSDQEIRDELLTLLEAGLETTATGLSWTFERLMRNPEVLGRLQEELERGEEEVYLDAVIKESLRSRPVIFGMGRLLDKPLRLAEYEIPAGWVAIPMFSLILQDSTVYPDPEEFRPERFLGDNTKAAQKSFLPFGGGRRYCVGAQLATMEMKVITREVLRHVRLTAVDPAPEAQRMWHATLVPGRQAVAVAHEQPLERRPSAEPATCPVHQAPAEQGS
ncbi:cytochrome P450 [Streptomyces sp. SL13]|uniref:Cytochrome P450 n=1 Tax=Streptantibioticus silvisoli TaxID=2705255 RepID=A0AA90H4V4_9ACTN|nr:cytochrome P450 [Streptantibioticus silvisoli]MDI5961318.1 cytochrome P450 [Streptantibioticus silvisoli]MDI5968840.1 cytochrome P450 [Streptantibioticus silvisoli]